MLLKTKTNKGIEVKAAEYKGGYRLFIAFTNGTASTVDFSEFLSSRTQGYLSKYRKEDDFKNFRIENGNLVWGKDWDLIFPLSDLQNGVV